MTMTFDKGSAILVEVVAKKRSPHASLNFFAPNTPFLTVTFQDSSATLVQSTSLTLTNASSTGLYDATIQTSANWSTGKYQVTIQAWDTVGSFYDVTVEPRIFELE